MWFHLELDSKFEYGKIRISNMLINFLLKLDNKPNGEDLVKQFKK